ncbi:tetratricopeptide repeat protein [Herbidospora sp. NEAU-GS84]|uniref:Tetratricopeptide repeat protein n=1 Tax=Herbidospora solisilvae TaxID=2696284 RepID=A0A7C9NNR7_9ACTN|nr:FxSxx-COOH system tetratricopeptide repeat protein [Herbidospora solisilvae]NAS27392.1 tetratricopeptide repeat protein [Herbidospora solisilvae]
MSAFAGPGPHHASSGAAPALDVGGVQDVTGSTVGRDVIQIGSARDVVIGDHHHHHQHQLARAPLPDAATLEAPAGLAGLPRPPAAVFVGRERVLAQARKALKAPSSAGAVITQAAVHGLGGIGKSELALQYAAAHRDDYRLVWWIEADTPAQMEHSLAGLARALCAGTHSVAAAQASVEEAAGWAMAWLAGHTGWLLIFDNLERLEDVRPFLGRLSGGPATRGAHRGHVLITTRRALGWPALGCAAIDLDVLSPQAAVTVLAGLIGPGASPEDDDVAGLAADLGCLPLALTQAGAFIAATPGMSVAGYRALLRQDPQEVYAAAAPGSDAERVIAKIWTITRDHIAAANPLAPRLLALLSCYAPDHLPIDVLHHLPGASRLQIGTALGVLASYSMITISSDNGTDRGAVSVHRLVQAVTWAGLPGDQRHAVSEQAADLLEAALPDDPDRIGNWPLFGRLLSHARRALAPDSPGMLKIIEYLQAVGDRATAKILQHQLYETLRDTLGREDRHTLTAQANLASLTGETGDAIAARDQFAALLPVVERVLGADHLGALTCRSNLARWTGATGDLAGARHQYLTAVPLFEHALGAEHPDTLIVRAGLAAWTGVMGESVAARDQMTALLPLMTRVFGAEHPHTLDAHAHLARWTGESGYTVQARDQFAALLPIRERVQGPEHPDTLSTRADLARWTGRAGSPVRARDLYAALLPIRKQLLGAKHPDTLATKAELTYWRRMAKGYPSQ